jgi:hypothetical protein
MKTHSEGLPSCSHILAEDVLSIQDACKALPTRPHHATVFRWMTRGCRGIVLESYRIGGQRITSTQALHRFFERTQKAT